MPVFIPKIHVRQALLFWRRFIARFDWSSLPSISLIKTSTLNSFSSLLFDLLCFWCSLDSVEFLHHAGKLIFRSLCPGIPTSLRHSAFRLFRHSSRSGIHHSMSRHRCLFCRSSYFFLEEGFWEGTSVRIRLCSCRNNY